MNRKRPGELQRLRLSNYNSVENRQSYGEFNDVSATEKILFEKFKRVVIRGKRGRGVPVLFSNDIQKHTELLASVRENFFPKPNPYLFGVPFYISATIVGDKVMTKLASLCDLKKPRSNYCNKIRKASCNNNTNF